MAVTSESELVLMPWEGKLYPQWIVCCAGCSHEESLDPTRARMIQFLRKYGWTQRSTRFRDGHSGKPARRLCWYCPTCSAGQG